MVMIVRLLGIFIVVAGVVFLLGPKVMKQYMSFWMKDKRLYAGGVLSLSFGVIFLLAASQCRLIWFVRLMAILSLIKGAALFALGPEKFKPMLDWWQKKSDTFLRLYAIFVIAMGILLTYSA